MTNYNYKLVYNGNLRWTDYRGPNPSYSPGIEVRLDIVTFDNLSHPVCHIHNYHTRCIAEDDKHVKMMLSAFVGVGRITHEIFGQMAKYERFGGIDSMLVSDSGLWCGFRANSRLLYLVDSDTLLELDNFLLNEGTFWHFIPLVSMDNFPLVLAIPLTNIGVK